MADSNERTPLSSLLADVVASDGGQRFEIPPDWLQGRAVYGGLSAAMCLHATVQQLENDLPPLRSMQVSFIGPAGGEVSARPQVVRQGKSTTFVTVDMHSDDKLAVRSTLCFAKSRESKLAIRDCPPPDVPGIQACGGFFENRQGANGGPNFAQHFNSRLAAGAMPVSGADAPDFTVWLQHKDSASRDTLTGLVALADALPPAAMACFKAPAPISSMTWLFDVLQDNPTTDDGWWLCRSRAEHTVDGYSSQAMTIWNTAGEPVLIGRQNIAIFY